MLVLSRKVNESIIINGNIIVKVIRVMGDRVKLGIEAPQDISIKREEICLEEKTQIQQPTQSIRATRVRRQSVSPRD